jgi:protein O-mannosyl-transferase
VRLISSKGLGLAASMTGAIALAAWLYIPGLKGPFVFDDFANLPALGAQGPIVDGPSLLRFLTSGKADPTGRPLSMASFLLEARDWPTDPFPFKRDNLLLHLLNGALLALLLLRLGVAMGMDTLRARFAAGFGAAAWLLHPLFVSTVLYVVQREAMLPATFTLLALLAWLRGRSATGQDGRLHAANYVFVYLLVAVATLCKANGLLIPLLIVGIEATLRATGPHDTRARRFTYLSFGPVAALVLAALSWAAITSIGAPPIPVRGWSVSQRLLTEPAILLDYVARLTLVAPPTSSVFHDTYPAAANVLSPWYTLPAMLACTGLITGALLIRRRYPVVAAAVLFFFAGHAMESSALSLELYFEHRNYLPAMLLFWPLGMLLHRLQSHVLRYGTAVALLGVAATMTHANVALWADPLRQAVVWASLDPDSPRAQAYAAQIEAQAGYVDRAITRIDAAANRFPTEPQIAFSQATLHCAEGRVSDATIAGVLSTLRSTPRDPGELLSRWLGDAVGMATNGGCDGMTLDVVKAMVDAAGANPAISALPGRRQDLAHLLGVIALARGNVDDALRWFNDALAQEPSIAVALNQAAILGTADLPSLGLRHLEYFDALPKPPPPSPAAGMRWIHALLLNRQGGYWEREINHLRGELQRRAKGQT